MNTYKVTYTGGNAKGGGSTEIKADYFRITHSGALAFYAQPHPQNAIEAFNKGTWTHVERGSDE